MAEWLRRGLQILARRFDSGSGLHLPRKAQAAVVGRIKTVEQRRRLQQSVRAPCKSLSRRQFLHPFRRRAAAPLIGWRSEPMRVAAFQQLGREVEEGAVLVEHPGAARGAVEVRLND